MGIVKTYAPALTLAIVTLFGSNLLSAAPRAAAGNDKAVAKLQVMLQSITAERDTLKAETAKITADLEQARTELQKQTARLQQLNQEKTAALSASDKLSTELSVQKSNTDATQSKLNSTADRLRVVTEQYEALYRVNQSVNSEHAQLQTIQKNTTTELSNCETKNLKLYETTKAMIEQYQTVQNKNLVDKILESEPLFKIDDVATETLLQDYQDKLNKQKLKTN